MNIDKLISDTQIAGKNLYLKRQELQVAAQNLQKEIMEVERAMIELDGKEKALLEVKNELEYDSVYVANKSSRSVSELQEITKNAK